MSDHETLLEETHTCGSRLVRVDESQPENTHGCDVVVCPSCLETVREERTDD